MKFVFKQIIDQMTIQLRCYANAGAVLTLMMLVVGLAAFLNGRASYAYQICDDTLSAGAKETGILTVYSSNAAGKNMEQLLTGISGIDSYGCVSEYEIDVKDSSLCALWNMTNYGKNAANKSECILQVVAVSDKAMGLCNLSFSAGNVNDEFTDETWEYHLYLGSDFKDANVGDVYEEAYGSATIRYIVCGILKEGSCWVSDNMFYEDFESSVIYLDHSVIMQAPPANGTDYTQLYYNCKDGVSIETVQEEIAAAAAEQLSFDVTLTTVSDQLNSLNIVADKIGDYLYELLVVVTVISVIMLISTMTVSTLQMEKTFGIWYANGASSKSIYAIMMGTQTVNLLLIWICAYSLAYAFINLHYKQEGDLLCAMYVLNRSAFPFCAAVSLVCVVIGLIIPMAWIHSRQPARLIEGVRE